MKNKEESRASLPGKSAIFDLRQDVSFFPEFQQRFLLQKNMSFSETSSFDKNNEKEDHSKSFNTPEMESIILKGEEDLNPPKKKKSSRLEKKYVLKLKSNPQTVTKETISKLLRKDLTTREIFFSYESYFDRIFRNFRYFEIKMTKICEKMLNIPIIQPFSKFKMLWDLFLFLNTIFLFFYIPANLCFMLKSEKSLRIPEIGMYIFDVLININLSFNNHDRGKSLTFYFKNFLFFDILALLSLIFDYDPIIAYDSLFWKAVIIKLLFFVKIHNIRKKFHELKEYFATSSMSQSKK